MRWLTLYARSRQVPASFAAILLGTVAVWALAADAGEGPADVRLPTLALAAGVTAASVGLGGQDASLDYAAAIRWVPRRALHVLLIGAVVGVTLLAVQALGEGVAPTAFVLRNSAGLAGLVALGAAVCGARNAWTLPLAWLAFAFFAPTSNGVPMEVGTWMLMPPDTAVATGTAVTLAAIGTVAYAVAGPRR